MPVVTDQMAQLRSPGTTEQRIVGPAIASAATIAPTHLIHEVTGTTQVTTITPPYTGFAGLLFLIWTNANPGGVGTGGNIAAALDPAQNKMTVHAYHPELAKWYTHDPLT